MINIILLAPPLSGKGTQANLLKEEFNLTHFSIGDMLRKKSLDNDEFALEIKKILSSGQLVSDDIAIELLKIQLSDNQNVNGYVFDGFPRTITQAEKLDLALSEINQGLNFVFLLNVDKEILEKRITGRRVCKKCNCIYNIFEENMLPNVENRCDSCHSELFIRSDDNLESFETRYQEYVDKTQPLIDYYNSKGILVNIDANKSVTEVFNQIKKMLEGNV